MSARMDKARDAIAWRLCNVILNTIGTRWYQEWIAGCIKLGLRELAGRPGVPEDRKQ